MPACFDVSVALQTSWLSSWLEYNAWIPCMLALVLLDKRSGTSVDLLMMRDMYFRELP